MNKIREGFASRIPRDFWPQEKISRREISELLFFHPDASIKEIASYFFIDVSDERSFHGLGVQQRLFAIDVETRQVLESFTSLQGACRALLITSRCYLDDIIRNQFAFSLYGRFVILSRTEHVFALNSSTNHSYNLPRFRKFLQDLGFDFISQGIGVNEIRRKLGFSPGTSLKNMMQHFFLPWGVRHGDHHWRDTVFVRIVSPTSVSQRMTIGQASCELKIHVPNVRDYVNREVFFRYGSNLPNSFFVLV